MQLKRKLLGRSAAGEKPLRGTLSGTLDITVVGARDIPSIKDSLVGDVVCEVRVGGGGFHARVRSNNDKAVSAVYERTFPPHFPRIVCLLRRSMQFDGVLRLLRELSIQRNGATLGHICSLVCTCSPQTHKARVVDSSRGDYQLRWAESFRAEVAAPPSLPNDPQPSRQ